ncbi:hypothetical protein NQ317_014946 [Molorchus minor]|uniref:Uncharacterized protein n=1 Tax=Molorchus minor TaxID=1323400 RepID=A0ABQ9K061_9CUCU|nr:hypothetical protein NQ317_014946 [Molorchus minor]
MFKHSKMPLVFKKSYPAPNIPHSFTGIHKVRKSRFEPVEKDPAPVERKSMNPQIRAKYLGEEAQNSFTESKPIIERLPKRE